MKRPIQFVLENAIVSQPKKSLGYVGSSVHNLFGGVRSVTYYGGATAVESYSEGWGGITLGNFVIGERDLQAEPGNSLFQHEYGHYLQSQASGVFYLPRYGVPSLFSTTLGSRDIEATT
ncbi:hypothetical protein [Sphingobacterium pedocola]|uniref:Uncharacterized protein n=1 Tax=Sphingobacterium pedocola TaxID=2082722 RepID=A0ABR9TCG9_9SPHI|nr:hypothetical protein [Sphingobacterium pedocola]MBE8723073.1 hypothetical protein [Sphingobacterium pedocola]